MSASEAQSEAHKFPADFKKTPGTLSVTATHIAWVPTEQGAMDRQSQALNRVVSESQGHA
jgi:transcription initiation factor TFIIH subunit 1